MAKHQRPSINSVWSFLVWSIQVQEAQLPYPTKSSRVSDTLRTKRDLQICDDLCRLRNHCTGRLIRVSILGITKLQPPQPQPPFWGNATRCYNATRPAPQIPDLSRWDPRLRIENVRLEDAALGVGGKKLQIAGSDGGWLGQLTGYIQDLEIASCHIVNLCHLLGPVKNTLFFKSKPCSEPEAHLLLKPHLTCRLCLSFQTLED